MIIGNKIAATAVNVAALISVAWAEFNYATSNYHGWAELLATHLSILIAGFELPTGKA